MGKLSGWRSHAPGVATGVISALLAAAVVAVVARVTKGPEPVAVNVAIVVDTSSNMRDRFGRATRFDAAIAELRGFVTPRDSDNLALWSAGGACGDQGTQELVPFDRGNSDRIKAALTDLRPHGPSNLGRAIIEATGAFSDVDRFPPGVTKSVVVVTAGTDTCSGDYVETIEERMSELGPDFGLKLYFVGLDVSESARRRLRQLERRQLVARAVPADTPTELFTDLADVAEEIDAGAAASSPATESPSPETPSPEWPPIGQPDLAIENRDDGVFVTNSGSDLTSEFTVAITSSDAEEEKVTFDGLDADDAMHVGFDCNAPPVTITVDPDAVVEESNEENNDATLQRCPGDDLSTTTRSAEIRARATIDARVPGLSRFRSARVA